MRLNLIIARWSDVMWRASDFFSSRIVAGEKRKDSLNFYDFIFKLIRFWTLLIMKPSVTICRNPRTTCRWREVRWDRWDPTTTRIPSSPPTSSQWQQRASPKLWRIRWTSRRLDFRYKEKRRMSLERKRWDFNRVMFVDIRNSKTKWIKSIKCTPFVISTDNKARKEQTNLRSVTSKIASHGNERLTIISSAPSLSYQLCSFKMFYYR